MRLRPWYWPMVLALVLVVVLSYCATAKAQIQLSFITSSDPGEFVDSTPIPLGSIDHRELRCGQWSGDYPMSMLLPASGRISQAQFLEAMPIKMDTTIYCRSRVAVASLESPLSNEIVLFCDRVGGGPQALRPTTCWRGPRVPPGQRR